MYRFTVFVVLYCLGRQFWCVMHSAEVAYTISHVLPYPALCSIIPCDATITALVVFAGLMEALKVLSVGTVKEISEPVVCAIAVVMVDDIVWEFAVYIQPHEPMGCVVDALNGDSNVASTDPASDIAGAHALLADAPSELAGVGVVT